MYLRRLLAQSSTLRRLYSPRNPVQEPGFQILDHPSARNRWIDTHTCPLLLPTLSGYDYRSRRDCKFWNRSGLAAGDWSRCPRLARPPYRRRSHPLDRSWNKSNPSRNMFVEESKKVKPRLWISRLKSQSGPEFGWETSCESDKAGEDSIKSTLERRQKLNFETTSPADLSGGQFY